MIFNIQQLQKNKMTTSLVERETTDISTRIKNEMEKIEYTSLISNEEQLELIYFFDASLSVKGTEQEMAQEFFKQIEKLRVNKNILVTLITFSGHENIIYYRENGKYIVPIQYGLDNCTALYNVVTEYLLKIRNEQVIFNQKHKTIVTIMTDGKNELGFDIKEKYTKEDLQKVIQDLKRDGWEFIYLAANNLAYHEAESLEIDSNNIALYKGEMEIKKAFQAIESAIISYDTAGFIDSTWDKVLKIGQREQ